MMRIAGWIWIVVAGLVLGCGGGGGRGGGDSQEEATVTSVVTAGSATFELTAASWGRAVLDGEGQLIAVVDPLSVSADIPHACSTDAADVLDGLVQSLVPGRELTERVGIDLAMLRDPLAPAVPVLPRDAAIVLEFSEPLAQGQGHDHAVLSDIVEVVDPGGASLPIRGWVHEGTLVVIADGNLGWPASPLILDGPSGPVVDSRGQLRLRLGDGLVSVTGASLVQRDDGALEFNPGNGELDGLPGAPGTAAHRGFNGFLPDVTAPRIVRTVRSQGVPREESYEPGDDLRFFVRMVDEWGNERTDQWDPSAGHFAAVPARTSLRLRFSEPLDPQSVKPYETLFVTDAARDPGDPAYHEMLPGVIELSDDGREVTFHPALPDGDGLRYLGFGGAGGSWRLVLRTLPDAAALESLRRAGVDVPDPALAGIPGVADRAGNGLALPAAMLDPANGEHFVLAGGHGSLPPAVDLDLVFQTQPGDDPNDRYGVVVHRFMGPARVTTDADGREGVEYADQPARDADGDGVAERAFVYGPRLLDLGLHAPGYLTGAPVQFIQHVVDDFNPPAPSPFASPNGEDFLIDAGFGTSTPLASPFGARFQQVFRAGDASPSQPDFEGTVLDLVGLAWAPKGDVSTQVIDDFELLVGLSGANRGRGPNTNQVDGIPVDPNSGLTRQFDCNLLEWNDTCFQCDGSNMIVRSLQPFVGEQPPRTTVVSAGTPYLIHRKNLFKPANAAGAPDSNQYLDYPHFDGGVDPFFGRDDVVGFPYDSRFPMLLEMQLGASPGGALAGPRNFYSFSPGIITSVLPRFRVWSVGQHPLAYGVPNWSLGVGPGPYNGNQPSYFLAGEGGPLLEPGSFSQDVLPPTLNNGMPTQVPSEYILPPKDGSCMPLQPQPDFFSGEIDDADVGPGGPNPAAGCITQLPMPNSDPATNFYFANGMFAYPLPELRAYPGPTGVPPTFFRGYGPPVQAAEPAGGAPQCVIPNELGQSNLPGVVSVEPAYQPLPSRYGDNARYFTLWKYKKRVSIVESPETVVDGDGRRVRLLRPVVERVGGGDLRVALRVGEVAAGRWIDAGDPDLEALLQEGAPTRVSVAFQAIFGTSPGERQPPLVDTIAIPYALMGR